MTYHYPFGGSTAGRTLQCPGWKSMSKDIPPQKASIHADIGTVCHEACEVLERDPNMTYEKLLSLNLRCNDAVLTEELLVDKVIPAYDALQDYIEDNEISRVYPEVQVQYDEDVGGTVDILGINHAETKMHIIDYKFGDGEMVYAAGLPQGNFYSWGAFEDETSNEPQMSQFAYIEEVAIVIIQPSERRDSIIDVWDTTREEVLKFGDTMLDAIEIAETTEPGDNLKTGKYCKYCPAAAICPEKNGQALQALRIDASPASLVQPITLKTALDLADELDGWTKQVRAFAHEQIELGVELEGWKLVKKRAQRKWRDEATAMKYLKRKLKSANAVVEKVISPAQAEKASKRLGIALKLEANITAESSGSTLVHADDKRPAVLSQAALAASLASIE